MRTACGIWELWYRLSFGISEFAIEFFEGCGANDYSFLVRDAQEDIAGTRLKQ